MSVEPEAPAAPEAPPAPEAAQPAEYPPEVWPKLYGAVLGLLVLDIVVFGLVTAWFS